MSETENHSSEHFDSLRARGRQLGAQCRHEEALATFEEALEWARRAGDRQKSDLAACNRATALVALGRGSEIVTEMKRILMASPDPVNKHLAAYNVSRHCEDVFDTEKGLFYARVALDHARRSEDSELMARSLNRLANELTAQSHFEEASELYSEALEALDHGDSLDRAFILDNFGYCNSVLGQHSAGFDSIFKGLRMLRRLRVVFGESQMHLDLCFAYLEIGRLDRAGQHGLIALGGAEALGDERQVKNCLYLLGDVAKLSGESRSAYEYFSRLQSEFYPDNGMIPHILMTSDYRQMVNLRA